MRHLFDFSSNYTRALREAQAGDKRSLIAALRRRVPLTRNDYSMLADFLADEFRPRGRPAHRPNKTFADYARSQAPEDRAFFAFCGEVARLEAAGESLYGKKRVLIAEIAERYGLDEDHMAGVIKARSEIIRRMPGFRRRKS